MYRKNKEYAVSKKAFTLSPEWELCEDNRWVVMATPVKVLITVERKI